MLQEQWEAHVISGKNKKFSILTIFDISSFFTFVVGLAKHSLALSKYIFKTNGLSSAISVPIGAFLSVECYLKAVLSV